MLKSVRSNRGLGIKAKKCRYDREFLPTALYEKESAERRKVNVLEMKCLRNLVRVSRMDRVRNEEVSRRAKKIKYSMAKSLPVENLLPQNVCSVINCLQ